MRKRTWQNPKLERRCAPSPTPTKRRRGDSLRSIARSPTAKEFVRTEKSINARNSHLKVPLAWWKGVCDGKPVAMHIKIRRETIIINVVSSNKSDKPSSLLGRHQQQLHCGSRSEEANQRLGRIHLPQTNLFHRSLSSQRGCHATTSYQSATIW